MKLDSTLVVMIEHAMREELERKSRELNWSLSMLVRECLRRGLDSNLTIAAEK